MDRARKTKIESRLTRKNPAMLPPHLIKQMQDGNIILKTNQKDGNNIYWVEHAVNEKNLEEKMSKANIHNQDDRKQIVDFWRKYSLTGYDVTGLRYIDDKIAIYNLDEKLNNWTHEKTNWVTNSTALASTKKDAPFIGISMVQYDQEKPAKMSEIRKQEKLVL